MCKSIKTDTLIILLGSYDKTVDWTSLFRFSVDETEPDRPTKTIKKKQLVRAGRSILRTPSWMDPIQSIFQNSAHMIVFRNESESATSAIH